MNKNVRLGYCCINMSLAPQGITANHGMIKKTFQQKGIQYAGEVAMQNLDALHKILQWNLQNQIYVYRMSSDMFPWMSEYEIHDLPNFKQLYVKLHQIGQFIISNGMRVSMHPGQFDVLASPTDSIVLKTIKDLNQHSEIMDLMSLPPTTEFPINIHIGGTYGDKLSASSRFCENFTRLKLTTRLRLVVENDDKASQYSVRDLMEQIWDKIQTPITFDYHHHRFNTGGLSEYAAIQIASVTWIDKQCTPLFHYSSCKRTFEDSSVIARAHADYIYEQINTYGLPMDIDLEAKAKDLAVLRYRENHQTLLTEYLEFDGSDKIILENVN